MNRLLNHKFWGTYSGPEWRALKISLAYIWFQTISTSNIDITKVPFPTGIFSIINLSFLASKYTLPVFTAIAFVLTVLYILERRMVITTFLIFMVSLLLFTLEESGGVLNRKGVFTMVFFAQFVAYFRNSTRLAEERVQFGVQVIAAGYMLAAISKLKDSGPQWFMDAPLITLPIIKEYSASFFDSGNKQTLLQGADYINLIMHHQLIAKFMLASALGIELFAWVAVTSKRNAFIYGILLWGLHIGIKILLNIMIVSVYYPMLFFMINPLYFFYVLVTGITQKIWPKSPAPGTT